jgi:mono/diheme cytochrome c family protein
MFGNLVVLLVVIAITIGLGYLTFRLARSSKRRLIKIPAVLLTGLLTLVLAAISFIGAKGLAATYTPVAVAAPILTVQGTPEQIARGQYLVNIACTGCHGTAGQFPLTGGFDMATEIPIPIGSMKASNLTPAGAIARYSDGELFRVLRQGIGKDGLWLGMMSSLPYRQLSDEDTQAIIAFLRSQPPVPSEVQGGDNYNFIGVLLFGSGMFPLPDPVAEGAINAPAKATSPDYGQYVATFGECRGCHGADMTGTPASPVGPAMPNPRPLVSTLTREQFTQMMRTGQRSNGVELQMPWQNASRMDDEDLGALYAYLTSKP